MAPEVKPAKNSKLPKLPETILSQSEKVGGHQYPPGSSDEVGTTQTPCNN
jgi:hypothetical protein